MDYLKRAKQDYEASELDDEELPIGHCKSGEPKEVIFAELGAGSYFGELSISQNDKEKQHFQEIRMGRCFTSVWTIQNTHLFYLSIKDYEDFLRE